MSHIVFGPQACGKTTHAEALRAHLGCDTVIDGAAWPRTQRDWSKFKAGNDLLLISDDECPVTNAELDRRIHHFNDIITELPVVADQTIAMDEPGYEKLADVLTRAYAQAAYGKGKERHVLGDEPFDEQVMAVMAKRFGTGALLAQAFKKSEESQRLPHERAVAELLGAINYLAGAVIDLERREELA